MPLSFAAADSTNEYLADGISESLISNLSQLPDLRVMSWWAVWKMKGKNLSPADIAEQLDVQAVMMGSLKPVGEGLRLSVELIDTRDQTQIWGDQYEGPMNGLLALQDQITSDIYRHIRTTTDQGEVAELVDYKTANSEAYAHYLKGRYFWNQFDPGNNQKSIGEFQQALDLDPTYALAYTGLADAFTTMAMFTNDLEAVEKARAYAEESIKLDETLAEGHYSLATIYYYYDWEWEKADASLQRAVVLNPNHAFAYQLMAARLSDAGQTDASLQHMQTALKLDPLSHRLNCGYGGMLLDAGKYDQAVKQAQHTLQLEYTCSFEHMVQGLGYVGMGHYDEGFAQLDTALEMTEHSPRYQVGLIRAHMIKGETEIARQHFEQLLSQIDSERRDPYLMAELHAALGDNEEALGWLEKAYEARSPSLTGILATSAFEDLRTNPRFMAIVEKMKLKS
jgi:TolB-like protein/Tfp pilus assembly protein PilF